MPENTRVPSAEAELWRPVGYHENHSESTFRGVQGADPLVLGAAAVILTAIALAACFVPARQAARIEPSAALRSE